MHADYDVLLIVIETERNQKSRNIHFEVQVDITGRINSGNQPYI
jgi:hypothetical protein